MTTYIIRGAFANPYELQNYAPIADEYGIRVITSSRPISAQIPIDTIPLWSPMDLPNFPLKRQILNRIYGDSHYLKNLADTIRGADIVHIAETYYDYSAKSALMRSRGGIKRLITTVWETIPHNNEKLASHRANKHLVLDHTDHFIAVTDKAKAALVIEGVSPDKISVIPMGIDTKKFQPADKQVSQTKYINILTVARLVPEKGVLDLLEAFHSLKKTHQKIKLYIVGDGPLRSELSGFKDVHLKQVSYAQMPGIYRQADIFVLGSHTTPLWEEQYGMCLVEAMASGLPIVTTRSGAIPQVVPSHNLFFDYSDSYTLIKHLETLITDGKKRSDIGRQNRSIAKKRYDHAVIARKIAKVYSCSISS
jgi:alpha-maltose-1-phosphate synthase